ncbi:MAG: pilus assembly protein [Acidiferrobacteraceae bacterium]
MITISQRVHLRSLLGRTLLFLVFLVSIVPTGAAQAGLLALSSLPLYVMSSVNSNLMFVLDTSGGMDVDVLLPTYNSMYFETGVTPNHNLLNGTFYLFPTPAHSAAGLNSMLEGDQNDPDPNVGRVRDYAYNAQYYDPYKTYTPWIGTNINGTTFGNASPTNALWNPYNPSQGGLNLTQETGNYRAKAYVDPCGVDVTSTSNTCHGTTYGPGGYYYTTKLFPAMFYLNVGGVETRYDICNPSSPPSNLPTGQSCATSYPNGLTYSQELQNFANWFQYSRTVLLALKGAVGQNLDGLAGLDVGMTGLETNTVRMPVANMSVKANRQALREAVYARNPNLQDWTQPFHERLYNLAQYYSQKTTQNGVPPPIQYACQQNFVALVTPGYLNDPGYPQTPWYAYDQSSGCNTPTAPWENPFTCVVPGVTVGNYDGSWGTPYADNYGDTLADWAAYYYNQNLRPDLTPGEVPIPPGSHETNTNPHMDTFVLAPGAVPVLQSNPPNLNPETTNPYTANPVWPQPIYVGQSTVDDLWHATVDGRGQFYNTPNLAAGVSALLDTVASRNGSGSAPAANSSTASSNSDIYVAHFSSSSWSGSVTEYAFGANGTLSTTPTWDAGQIINTQNWNTGRQILTYTFNGGSTGAGVPFRWTNLGPNEQAYLNTNIFGAVDNEGPQRLTYLRGDPTNEGTGLDFRVRPTSKLGDFIDSALQYVGPPVMNYQSTSYAQFVQTYANRTPMVYGGANDGMLHGFDANTGQELLAFVPRAVYDNLSALTAPTYTHRFYVDGSPTVGDAEFSNNTWHTVLVSGLGAGGRGIFALDVTNPQTFSESNASNLVLWELDATSDPDIGYTFAQPTIVQMANGEWAAVFGNGYNSTGSGHAILYIVDIQTGAVISKIDTGVGSTTTPDGLSTPVVVDSPGTTVAQYIYAGDIDGNLWKFDVSATNPSQWGVAYSSHGKPAPLYQAVDSAGNPQPITVQPAIGQGPSIGGTPTGYMVYFGTGTYMLNGDNTNTSQQSIYGIWDDGQVVPNRVTANVLVQQTITNTVAANGSTYRVVSDNPVTYTGPPSPMGWYIDLTTGERSVRNPVLHSGRINFTTTVPSNVPCSSGGTSWVMELDPMTGGQLNYSVFDVNGNGVINNSDFLTLPNGTTAPASGVEYTGILSAPTIIAAGSGTGNETLLMGTTGTTQGGDGAVPLTEAGGKGTGRVSWIQLR